MDYTIKIIVVELQTGTIKGEYPVDGLDRAKIQCHALNNGMTGLNILPVIAPTNV